MLDPKFIRENPDVVRKSLKDRGDEMERLDKFLDLDKERRDLIQKAEGLKKEKNEASKKIGQLIKDNADVSQAKAEVNELSDKINELDKKLKDL
ncbi:MAG: serine--tRNA ligase, partial [Candidatus Omnitrophota bacterium]